MPRPRIDDLVIANVIEVFVDGELKLTADEVTKEVKRMLGSRAPSLRKVQETLKDHRELVAFIEEQPVLSPLGEGWPKDPDDVYYLWTLSRAWEYGVQPRWTQSFINAAFEIKRVLGWPSEFPNRFTWKLPSPYGGRETVPGELAIIGEISNRRIVSENIGQQIPMDDLYAILLQTPWVSRVHSLTLIPTYFRVMVEGIVTALSLDIFREEREVHRKIEAAYRMSDDWGRRYYNDGLDPDEDKAVTLKREKDDLKILNELEAESAIALREFLGFLEELPQIHYVTDCRASLRRGWRDYTGVSPEATREELSKSLDSRSKSSPESWYYAPRIDVDDLPF